MVGLHSLSQVNPSGKPSVPLGGPVGGGTGSGVVLYSFETENSRKGRLFIKKDMAIPIFGFFFWAKTMTGFLV